MANASGRAWDHAIPGDLFHAPSRTTYRVYAEDNSLWLSYAQTGNSGRQKLEYFLGSGHLGLTYLYTIHGYLLETPVAYYANTKAYDMKPGLGPSTRMPAALPMSPGCMRCHMSGVQRTESGTKNRFQGLPFLHGGITCESCHGDTKEHVRTSGRAAVINPIKLDADRRDSICISCHLEGDTSVEHRGRSVLDYRPGERIEDYISYFVLSGTNTNRRGVSEIEQLSLSLCKRSSGDRMSCMSCHDPHFSPAFPERAAFTAASASPATLRQNSYKITTQALPTALDTTCPPAKRKTYRMWHGPIIASGNTRNSRKTRRVCRPARN
jgi:hypothetical protein